MSVWWLIMALIGAVIHTIGCCMLTEQKKGAGELISFGFGLFAAVMIIMVSQ